MLVGRDAERARIDRLLEGARDGRSGALLIVGDPGVGKTALLETAAAAPGFRLLRAIGIESEGALGYSGLMQLLRPVLGWLAEVPDAQALALRRALGEGGAGDDDRFLVAAGTLSLLAAAADAQPLLCLVDDAHWLDRGSADALAFTARRIEAEPIAMIFAARPAEGTGFDGRGIESLEVGGLDRPAARDLLARQGGDIAAPVAARLIDATGGNPLALIEVPRAMTDAQRAGRDPVGESLPTSETIERAFLSRAHALSAAGRWAVLLAAAGDTDDVDVVLRAAAATTALDEAETAGLLRVRGRAIRFRHPLVRSAVYSGATESDRRAAHTALADVIDDPGRRSWHLAEAAVGPDEGLARALEQAAAIARRRSAEDEGRLLERAARMTADGAQRVPRLLRAGMALRDAGRGPEAMALFDEGLELVEDPLMRADLHEARLFVARMMGDVGANIETCLAEAARVEALDPLRAANLLYHATYQAFDRFDLERSEELARKLEQLAPSSVPALVHRSRQAQWTGVTENIRAPALAALDTLMAADRLDENAIDAAEMLTVAEEYRAAAAVLERAVPEFRARARLLDLVRALTALAYLELRVGNVARASVAAHEAVELSGDATLDYWGAWSLVRLAGVQAVTGHAEDCRANASRALEICADTGDRETEAHAYDALGRLELGLGRTDEAIAGLTQARALAGGLLCPGYIPWRPDLVEALTRAGRDAEAAPARAEIEARRAEGPWAGAVAARCRALLDGGDVAFEQAIDACGDRVAPFERARTLLVYGERLRRDNRRRAAREHLAAALREFDRVGASSWSARAHDELRASGQTVRPRGPGVTEQLTPRELEIALHAAAGLTNREIGARLFLSPKTVELHLSRIYRRLGVRSRTELARAMPRESGLGESPYAAARDQRVSPVATDDPGR